MTELLRATPAIGSVATTIIKTPRLTLRAPRAEDASAITAIANDRRIAENTARIPHPYRLTDAQEFITYVLGTTQETIFVITLPGDRIIGTTRVCRAGLCGAAALLLAAAARVERLLLGPRLLLRAWASRAGRRLPTVPGRSRHRFRRGQHPTVVWLKPIN